MHRYRRMQIITICALVVAIVTLGVGFAAFSTTLNISSSANVSPNSDDFRVVFLKGALSADDYVNQKVGAVERPLIVSEIVPTVTNGATGSVVTINGLSDESNFVSGMKAEVTEPNQSVIYDFFVGNIGKYDAYLRNVNFFNVDGNSSNKVCTSENGATDSLVQAACDSISVSFQIGNDLYTETKTNISNKILHKGSSLPVRVTISYDAAGARADGPFNVEFGNISLDFSTVQSTSNLISFTIGGVEYQAEDGMTWSEWYLSDHFTLDRDNFFVDGGLVHTLVSPVVYDDGSTFVGENDQIIDGHSYVYASYAFNGQ